ncbi:ABC transporter permease [Cytobacillus sp. FJAT-53684]|uniref:ABC transporter permease n=1 Tax=Cytobacillus mangrovibacter TaxID=3299024 RepID=A0ABW6JY05_9BACI
MNKLIVSFSVERKKFFRSKIPFITACALLLVPFIGGLFMFILKDPVFAQKVGIISAKAQIAGTADWPSYFGLLAQAISIGGLLVFGFITSWMFGREYSDRTIKDLLALPISRNTIVLSKFLVIVLWCFLLSIIVFIIGLIVGAWVDIPGYSKETLIHGLTTYFVCSILTILLSAPVSLFASIGRGYLSPLGFVLFTMVLAQIIAATGYGQYFPWAVPALLNGVAGNENIELINIAVFIVLFTSFIGFLGTLCWWKYADHH